jgi:hypothetical protein
MYQVRAWLATALLLLAATGNPGCYGSCFCGKPPAEHTARPAAGQAADSGARTEPGNDPQSGQRPYPASATEAATDTDPAKE